MSAPAAARFALAHASVELVAHPDARHLLERLPAPPPIAVPPEVRVLLARARRPHREGRQRDLHFDDVTSGPRPGGRWLGDGRSLVRIRGGAVLALLHDDTQPSVADGVLVLAGLAFALRSRGVFHLHAACLRAGGGAVVLIAGGSGVGKTTLALALRAAGLTLASDDASFLGARGGALLASGWPRAPHLGPATWEAFGPTLTALGDVRDGPRPKRAAAFPGAPLGPLPADRVVLLLPSVSESETRAEECSAEEALLGLLEPSALVALPGDPSTSRAHLALLGRVAAAASAHRVALGRDLLEDPTTVGARLLARLALEPDSP